MVQYTIEHEDSLEKRKLRAIKSGVDGGGSGRSSTPDEAPENSNKTKSKAEKRRDKETASKKIIQTSVTEGTDSQSSLKSERVSVKERGRSEKSNKKKKPGDDRKSNNGNPNRLNGNSTGTSNYSGMRHRKGQLGRSRDGGGSGDNDRKGGSGGGRSRPGQNPMINRLDHTAAIFVVLGPDATKAGFFYAVNSLRQTGGFQGNIYIGTDRAHCLPPALLRDRRVVVFEASRNIMLGSNEVRNKDNWWSQWLPGSEGSHAGGSERQNQLAVTKWVVEMLPPEMQYILLLQPDVLVRLF
jgi:hypothetical protein